MNKAVGSQNIPTFSQSSIHGCGARITGNRTSPTSCINSDDKSNAAEIAISMRQGVVSWNAVRSRSLAKSADRIIRS